MNPLIIAIISIALSVAAQFSLKAGMSGAEIKTILAQPLGCVLNQANQTNAHAR